VLLHSVFTDDLLWSKDKLVSWNKSHHQNTRRRQKCIYDLQIRNYYIIIKVDIFWFDDFFHWPFLQKWLLFVLLFMFIVFLYMAYICEYFAISYVFMSVFNDDIIYTYCALEIRSDSYCYISKFYLKSLLFEFDYCCYYYCNCGGWCLKTNESLWTCLVLCLFNFTIFFYFLFVSYFCSWKITLHSLSK